MVSFVVAMSRVNVVDLVVDFVDVDLVDVDLIDVDLVDVDLDVDLVDVDLVPLFLVRPSRKKLLSGSKTR